MACRHATSLEPAYADSDNNDDNKSSKSDEDNDEEAKEGSHEPEGSTPEPEGADARAHSDKQQEEQQQNKLKHKTWQDRDAEFEARIAELTLRSEPVGLDRHHRKYWVLTGMQMLFMHYCVKARVSAWQESEMGGQGVCVWGAFGVLNRGWGGRSGCMRGAGGVCSTV